MNIQQLQEKYPEAFKALPESYRIDSSLEFYQDEYGLYAYPKAEKVEILGEWEAMFLDDKWEVIDPYGSSFDLT